MERGIDNRQEFLISTAASQVKSSTLRAGDLVEIRPEHEILATLDEDGTLDGLPFMPEMLRFCGERVRVQSRAHKTCDTILSTGLRRLDRAVHLAELRCDGSSHSGCQASCLLFWKEEWLRPVETTTAQVDDPTPDDDRVERLDGGSACTRETLTAAASGPRTAQDEETYRCQATELRRATSPLAWWDVRQYAEDLESRNVTAARLLKGLLVVLLNKFQAANTRYLPRLTPIARGSRYPFVAGSLEGKTPESRLDLEPGERVRIKSKEEIEKTLDRNNKNRGLLFDGVMGKYCGQTAIVRARVTRIINERTGTMRHFSNEAIMLEGIVCTGDYMQLCPRRIYDYWREIWLERSEGGAADVTGPQGTGTGVARRGEKARPS